MKISSWLPCLIKSRLLCFLVLVLKLTDAAENPFQRVVGGNVTFYCPVDEKQELQFLYLQKGDIFVNGYYNRKSVSPWPNTRLDLKRRAIHMYGLNLSHTGEYKCHFKYINSAKEPNSVSLHLLVTAPFRKPLITQTCESNACNVTCASHSGYPKHQITWQIEPNSNPMWETKVLTNPTTKTLNISSKGYINCSNGEVKVNCSVGSIISDVISVCATISKPSDSFTVKIAVVFCLLGLAVAVIICILIYKKRKNASSRSVMPDGHPLEKIHLSGGEEAP